MLEHINEYAPQQFQVCLAEALFLRHLGRDESVIKRLLVRDLLKLYL